MRVVIVGGVAGGDRQRRACAGWMKNCEIVMLERGAHLVCQLRPALFCGR